MKWQDDDGIVFGEIENTTIVAVGGTFGEKYVINLNKKRSIGLFFIKRI